MIKDDLYRNRIIEKTEYTQDNIYLIVGQPSAVTGDITDGEIRRIEKKYQQKYCNQLASEFCNIESIIENGAYRTASEKNQAFDDEKILPKLATTYGGITVIYDDALKYYEYIQFKRSYFDCVGKTHGDIELIHSGGIINVLTQMGIAL